MKKYQGFTLIEVNLALVIIGTIVIFLSVLYLTAIKASAKALDINKAVYLGTGLMEEIKMRGWDENTSGGSAVLGPEAGETNKTMYNDIDDFNNYNESSILSFDGSAINGFDSFSRSVTVNYVLPDTFISTTTVTARKQVVLIVNKLNKPVYTLTALFSQK